MTQLPDNHSTSGNRLLQGGLIVDGTGNPAFPGNLLIRNGQLQIMAPEAKIPNADVIDCRGKVIAPGFIDVHSHMDYFAIGDAPEQFDPFVAQGITSMVVGNCGFSPFGFKCDSPHHHLIENSLFKAGHGAIDWSSFTGYRQQLQDRGIRPNVLSLVGHGACRTSLSGFSATPLPDSDHQQMLGLLDEAMEQGAAGVSLGLQYKPGVFASRQELIDVARLVQHRDRILTVHAKAYSVLSGTYPMNPLGKAHNLRAIDEMLDLARETGVKLQFSHLIFVGKKTWPTLHQALDKFDRAIADGVDVKFDMFPYPFGATLLNTLLPEWVMSGMPDILHQRLPMLRLRLEALLGFRAVGLDYACIQISEPGCQQYQRYTGLSLAQIARKVGRSPFAVMLDLLDKSNAEARMIMHRYYDPEVIPHLMQHPAAMFMTDSWPEPSGIENAASFGSFPRFLQIARNTGCLSLEDIIARMTGDAAKRFGFTDRGLIKDGLHADICVFDWHKIQDNSSASNSTAAPTGIEQVYINGVPVVTNSTRKNVPLSGEFLVANH
ncbi:amidohydrolase family protein [Aestuariirhabdus sp. Z084]|uniref:N-acyl-D-amino-acid deacylase family protein n=1 Tax=Aestuariirhabdus haliotis TaxID=2918751 RepID=UPI00201B3B2F|nr:amidohydrolase family protein [Aestuariirhabdus haliotis]MCL6415021.1 amidohydrolase family protein [Aestuariirhabdus haliotis]MCL6418953.1 amidohydrolase family protein [Aestuariirhabdus haliotis]